MLLDTQSTAVHEFRNRLDVLIFPLQIAVDKPIKAIHSFTSSVKSSRQLLAENAKLRAHEFLLEAKLQKLLSVERQNVQLKALLQSEHYLSKEVMAAELLAVNMRQGIQQVIVNKGRKAHIYVGQPVLDAYGVMGQVIDVGSLSSRVLLLTDKASAIPIQDYRSGVRAIAVGVGSLEHLKLVNVPDTSDIKPGDLLLSSGLGLRYPVGYPVGVVQQVDKHTGDNYARILLTPSAHMDRTSEVLLTWPINTALHKQVTQQLKAPLVPGMPHGVSNGSK